MASSQVTRLQEDSNSGNLNPYAWHVQNNLRCCGGTSSSNTGPFYDHTLGNGTEAFMFVESSNGGDDSTLISPCIDFTRDSSIELSFWYHKYGRTMGELFVDINANGIWYANIDSIIGQTHFSSTAPWLQRDVNLNQFAGNVIEFRFRAPYDINNNFLSDIAIDDVHIYNPLTVGVVDKEVAKTTFTLYPNPNNGNFNLKATSDIIGNNYQIFDIKGSLVQEDRISSTKSQIELGNAKKGVYFFKIVGTNEGKKWVV